MEVAEGRKAVAGGGGGKPNGGLPCPRCLSTNTKFSYYNNYSLAQPRHFCKACRRYWTLGGALRDVPVGGGTRKKHAAAARSRPAPGPSTAQTPTVAFAPPYALAYASVLSAPAEGDTDRRLLDPGGSFSSLLAPAFNGLYAGFMGASASEPGAEVAASVTQPPVAEALPVGYWGLGWPDLSM